MKHNKYNLMKLIGKIDDGHCFVFKQEPTELIFLCSEDHICFLNEGLEKDVNLIKVGDTAEVNEWFACMPVKEFKALAKMI